MGHYLDLKLGYSCNNNCIHCVIADQRKFALKVRGNQDRSTEEYKKELLDSKSRGCDVVTLTGGEPTIRKDIFELVAYAKQLGYGINMQTNGRMFSYLDFAKKMSAITRIYYVIAVHSDNAKVHDSITRTKGSFNQTINGIKNLIALGQPVSGKVVISKKNYKSLPKIAKLFSKLKIKNTAFAFPHAQGNAWKYFDDVVPKYSDIKQFVHKTIDFCNKKGIKVLFEAIPFCFMQGYEKNVTELTEINTDYSELKQLGNQTLNWAKYKKQIKSKFPNCTLCKYNAICEGVWKEYPAKYGFKEFLPQV